MAASVRLQGIPVGTLSSTPSGALTFEYLPAWVDAYGADSGFSRSVSMKMPVRAEPYEELVAGPFFDGLLPESKRARQALAEHFDIPEDDNFRLLLSLGRDCPGAISIVPEDTPVVEEGQEKPSYHILTESEISTLIKNLPTRPLFVDADGELRLSLAGVHGKAAILRVGHSVAIPHGRTATSHILKVDIPELKDSIRVEHFCLRLSAAMGLRTPKVQMHSAGGTPYMLVARYDRVVGEAGGGGYRYIRRIHQEDFCQALGRYPGAKYEKDGGPGWRECFDLIGKTADPGLAREELIRRAIFQYLVNNPDAHSKNYSLIYRHEGPRLAPIYDVNNAAAFKANFKETRPRLAMAIGGERDPTKLTMAHWEQFAGDAGVRPEAVIPVLTKMAETMPDLVRGLREEMRGSVADSHLLDIVIDDIAHRCREVLAAAPSPVRPTPSASPGIF